MYNLFELTFILISSFCIWRTISDFYEIILNEEDDNEKEKWRKIWFDLN